MNDWTKSIDANEPVDVLYIDLAKAFDSVPHSKLLQKLEQIGIGGSILRWLRDFLTRRTHCVRVRNSDSSFEPVQSGIPQGTILGPTLFLLYVNGVLELNLSGTLKLFADDAKIYRPIHNAYQKDQMQLDIHQVTAYFSEWQLKVNTSKSEALHLGSGNLNFEYTIAGDPVNS